MWFIVGRGDGCAPPGNLKERLLLFGDGSGFAAAEGGPEVGSIQEHGTL